MKKLTLCLVMVMLVFASMSGLYATDYTEIMDVKSTNNVYKFSDDGDIYLPFVRSSTERIVIDKDVNKSGMSYSSQNISVEKNLKGIQTLMSSDAIRVQGNMEYGILIAPTVIIDGTVDKSLLIIAQNLTISENAVIKEDIVCSVAKLELLGNVEGSVLGAITQANILGKIGKDFRAYVDGINLSETSAINGKIYISSYNNIDIGNKYPNATVKIMENVKWYETIHIDEIIISSIVFALIYLLVTSKTNIFKNMLDRVQNNRPRVLIYGAFSIILVPLAVILFILLLVFRLEVIAVPLAIIYGSFVLVACILSNLVVGSVISEYIMKKNENIKGNLYKLVFTFFVFVILSLVCTLPYVGEILVLAFCMISAGILLTSVFKRKEI